MKPQAPADKARKRPEVSPRSPAGLYYLVLSQLLLLLLFTGALFIYLALNRTVLFFYEEARGYLIWPLFSTIAVVLAIAVICAGVGRRGVDPVRGPLGRLALAACFLGDFLLFYLFLLQPFSVSWSFLSPGEHGLVWGLALLAVSALLLLAVPLIVLLPALRHFVNGRAIRDMESWLGGRGAKPEVPGHPDKGRKGVLERCASAPIIRHCAEKKSSPKYMLFRMPSDHLLRFLQCRANNDAAEYEKWWGAAKWSHFSGVPAPSGADNVLGRLLNSQSDLVLYARLYALYPSRTRNHLYAHPLFVRAVEMRLAFEQFTRLQLLDVMAGECQKTRMFANRRKASGVADQDALAAARTGMAAAKECLETYERLAGTRGAMKEWAARLAGDAAAGLNLEEPIRNYLARTVEWASAAVSGSLNAEDIFLGGKEVIVRSLPWELVSQTLQGDRRGDAVRAFLQRDLPPCSLFLERRIGGRKGRAALAAAAPLVVLRVVAEGAFALWLARMAHVSPGLAVKVRRETVQELLKNGDPERAQFLCGPLAHRVLGDTVMFHLGRGRRIAGELRAMSPPLLDEAEEAYAMAGAPADLELVRRAGQ